MRDRTKLSHDRTAGLRRTGVDRGGRQRSEPTEERGPHPLERRRGPPDRTRAGRPDIPDLGEYLNTRHRSDLLRVQTLEYYGVPSDDDDYLRYINGEPEALSPYREPWLKQLRDNRAAGKVWRNVHVVHLPLNDYLRYQFEWCYADNVQAGMDVRILDTTAHPEAARLFTTRDFYVVDGLEAIEMRYAEDGTYLGAVSAPSASTNPYATIAELAWDLATPFDQWWAEHPEFHRVGHMVT